MKRMLGMKKKRRQPGDMGLDGDQEAGLQGFGAGSGSSGGVRGGIGSGIGSASPPSLGMSGSRSSTASAKYQYAMRHYQETADPLRGDVDSKAFNRYENPMNDAHARGQGSALGGGESSVRRRTPEVTAAAGGGYGGGGNGIISGGATTVAQQSQRQQPPSFEDLTSIKESHGEMPQQRPQQQGYVPPTNADQSPHDAFPASAKRAERGGEGGPMMSPTIDHGDAASKHSASAAGGGGDDSQMFYASGSGSACPPDPHLPDITYEEHYGDAYVGKPIKYIYPAGYQSMRPRSRPWKLSIAVFILFMWLTVFIVGYCSDMAKDEYAYLDDSIDDDQVVIEQRWCGSRPLYGMWVMSVLITGMSCAYCSIIGYIQVRDFSIANGRSQPPEMAGRSDYYVKVGDGDAAGGGGGGGSGRSGSGRSSYSSYQDGYGGESTIYQADGTPQFWGSHIYKPTQAAVAVTSR